METTFLQNSILIQGANVHPYVLLLGAIVWGILSLLGILFWKHPMIGKKGILFSLLTFTPLSLVCVKSYQETNSFSYHVQVDGESKQVRFGDTQGMNDLEIPFSDWVSYQIHSDAESKKDGWKYTDTIYLKHRLGLLIPVSTITVRKYTDKSKEFSRYLDLNRELKKFFRFMPLPIEDELGDSFSGLPIPLDPPKALDSNTSPNLEFLRPNSLFPIQWEHSISNANWYFSFCLLAVGHLGLLILLANLTNKEMSNIKMGVVILLVGYLSFGIQFYFWIGKKMGMSYQIERLSDGYALYGITKKGKDKLQEWKQTEDLMVHLELPSKYIWVQSRKSYESTRSLAKSLLDPNSELTSTLNHTKDLFTSSQAQRWDLSDLPMEVAVRFFLVLCQRLDPI